MKSVFSLNGDYVGNITSYRISGKDCDGKPISCLLHKGEQQRFISCTTKIKGIIVWEDDYIRVKNDYEINRR